jgi:hypothetical protein
MEYSKNLFLLASNDSDDSDSDSPTNETNRTESKNVNNIREEIHSYSNMFNSTYVYNENDNPSSPRLIDIKLKKNWLDELNTYFKLNNLFTCIRNDENKKQKQDISISNTIMNNIIDKKLGYTTYHYGNNKSAKAYYTYDYPEIYYNKKLYNNISEWLKEEFSKKV